MAFSEPISNPVVREWVNEIRDQLKDYPGHGTPEARRLCDESLRAFLVHVSNDFLYHVGTLETYLARSGREELRQRAQQAEQRIDSFLDKLQSTPYAYSLFLTAERVPESVLERIVAEDRAIILSSRTVQETLQQTLSPQSDLEDVIDWVLEAIDELDDRIEARASIIIEFQG
ncbi:hypothetical protein JW916_12800 [Candidatus Sumerlaeota bacterium]|nr:hypothetical protein [Candidatus Sumerlaeota bacterium]